MSIEQDLREHQAKEEAYNVAYEFHFKRHLQDKTLLEEMMMDEYPDIYEAVLDLDHFHQAMLEICDKGYKSFVKDKWLEYVHIETIKTLEG